MQLIIRTYNHQHLEKCLLKPKKHASSSYGNGTLDKIVIEILLKSKSLKSKSFVVHTSAQKRIGIGLTFDWQKKLGLYQIPSPAEIRPFVQIRLRPKFGRISGFQPDMQNVTLNGKTRFVYFSFHAITSRCLRDLAVCLKSVKSTAYIIKIHILWPQDMAH